MFCHSNHKTESYCYQGIVILQKKIINLQNLIALTYKPIILGFSIKQLQTIPSKNKV